MTNHSDVLSPVSGALPTRPFNLALMGPFAHHGGSDWKDLGVLLAWCAAALRGACPPTADDNRKGESPALSSFNI